MVWEEATSRDLWSDCGGNGLNVLEATTGTLGLDSLRADPVAQSRVALLSYSRNQPCAEYRFTWYRVAVCKTCVVFSHRSMTFMV